MISVVAFTVVISSVAAINNVFIGIISGPEDDSRQNNERFWSSNDTRIQLHPNVQDIPWWSSRQVTRATCSLLQTGSNVIVSGAPYLEYRILQSYSERFHIPMITTRAPNRLFRDSNLQLSMMPNSAKAIVDLMQHYGWNSFIFFYDNDEGPYMLESILEASEYKIEVEAVWQVSSGEEAQRFLQWLRPGDESSKEGVLLSTKEHLVDSIIATLSYGTGLKRWFHFIITDPVGIVEEGSRYEAQGSFMITKLSLGNSRNAAYLELENRWNTLYAHRRRPSSIVPKVVPTSALLLRDAAYVLTTATRSIPLDIPSFNMTPQSINCLEDTSAYATAHATALTNLMKKVAFPDGKSGNLKFSQKGERDEYSFEVTETTPLLVRKVGTWSKRYGLRITEKPKQEDKRSGPRAEKLKDTKPKYIVTSFLASPYLMRNATDESQGKNEFQGFIKDLLDVICENLGCDYEIRIVKDGSYGIKKVNNSESPPREWWSGMIGEVMREEADMAVADLTITKWRKEVVDFTRPFMTIGLNMMIKKPEDNVDTSYIGVLGFLRVWSYEVWLVVLLTYAVFGAANFAASHYTAEPERIRSLDTKLSDRLSVSSSYWYTFGSMFFRDTGIYPRSISHRLLSIVWWFFSLAFLAFYISSLTSMLIKARTATHTTHSSKRSIDLLQSAVEKGYPQIGCIYGGSTHAFFKNSEVGLYHEFGNYLSRHPEAFVRRSAEGRERVRKSGGGYAMIMESSSSEYHSNLQPCDVMVSSGYLDQKTYGVALKKGSALRGAVDHAILELTEAGTLRTLYEKWWYHQRACEDPYMNIIPSVYSNFLTLEEVSGVFYLLILGLVVSISLALCEFYRQPHNLTVAI